jgi:aldehyde dehydrogenase (NAD+)
MRYKCTITLAKVVAEGGKIVEGGVLSGEGYESGCYVKTSYC